MADPGQAVVGGKVSILPHHSNISPIKNRFSFRALSYKPAARDRYCCVLRKRRRKRQRIRQRKSVEGPLASRCQRGGASSGRPTLLSMSLNPEYI